MLRGQGGVQLGTKCLEQPWPASQVFGSGGGSKAWGASFLGWLQPGSHQTSAWLISREQESALVFAALGSSLGAGLWRGLAVLCPGDEQSDGCWGRVGWSGAFPSQHREQQRQNRA